MPALAPPRRLGTLQKSSIGRPKPPQRNAPAPKKVAIPNCCESPKIEEEDGRKVCVNCFTQIDESNIVSDVTFQEDSRGAAQVQGGVVGEGARFARSLGSVAQRRVGGGERDTAAQIDATGRRQLSMLCPRLGISDIVSQQAGFIWGLAAKLNFTAGRRTDEVVAACLYAACRRQSDNNIILMDLSEIVKVNVFRLGEVYKDLVKELYLDGGENPAAATHLVEVEPLIMKYCRKLEFGDMTRQVCEDAIKIVKRMKRDWINTGRHPAGLCGACIILAARMNNFRRTVREIVYVSKVADVTVAKRVEEFRRTKSAAMTVEDFRKKGYRLKQQHDPPAYYLAADKRAKWELKKRKRQISQQRASGQTSPADTSPGPRRDADGFVLPSAPASSNQHALQQEQPQKKKRGRPRKNQVPDPPQQSVTVSEEELATEAEIEDDIETMLQGKELREAHTELERAKLEENTRQMADQQRAISVQQAEERRDRLGIRIYNQNRQNEGQTISADDLEAEFIDDEEVNACLLSPEEVAWREKVWVSYNEDWLRSQYEKDLAKKIAEAEGLNKTKKDGGKGGRGRKRKGKKGEQDETEATTPIETPGDASAAMLAKRAQPGFSKHVNYDQLVRIYGERSVSSRAGSEAPSANGDGTQTRPSPSRQPSASPVPSVPDSPPPASRNIAPTTSLPMQQEEEVIEEFEQPQTEQAQEQEPTEQRAEGEEEHVEEEEDQEEEEDVREDESDAGYGFEIDDQREDIGEDDYDRALDPAGEYGAGYYDDDW
ncbi:hypothetical protein K431DRAFT_216628 [Polychaeton citri CBS 116435]|uniref:Uncharacterized protein n=1 Tax=Polychaeton citri CBS 116435 TaxID=1314669 RepID=A0A9P4UTR4_9PEZI|nr:hypothetical protein K431DRAFT_216628 [Polychaeton citri CBS 116435]